MEISVITETTDRLISLRTAAVQGPYVLSDWNRQSYLDFTAYDNYWKGWSEGQIKKARMQTILEESDSKDSARIRTG